MDKIIPFPKDKPDVREMMLNGKPEMMLSARGVMLVHLVSWKRESPQRSPPLLRVYHHARLPGRSECCPGRVG